MVDTLVTVLGTLVLGLGLCSKWLEKSPVPATVLALLAGVALGPQVLDVVDPARHAERAHVLETVARLVLGVGLVSVALRIPKGYPRRHWREMAVLIGLGMPLMWITGTLLVYFILGGSFWLAALVGAIIAATDPIAASPIVTGPVARENLPDRVRNAVSFESGANDGLSYLLVFLALLMLAHGTDQALSKWLVEKLLWDVLVATLFGLVLGYAAAMLLRAAERRDAIEEDWRLVYTVALSLVAVGGGKLLDSDEVLVVFAAGAAFAQTVGEEERGTEEKGQEAVNRFFSIPIFALLGTTIPWEGWAELGWRGLALALAVLALRRLPALVMLRPLLPSLGSAKDTLFVGWFGPIAVAAIYYSALAERELGDPWVWHVVSLLICASVLVHGLTATPLTRLYGSVRQRHVRASDRAVPRAGRH